MSEAETWAMLTCVEHEDSPPSLLLSIRRQLPSWWMCKTAETFACPGLVTPSSVEIILLQSRVWFFSRVWGKNSRSDGKEQAVCLFELSVIPSFAFFFRSLQRRASGPGAWPAYFCFSESEAPWSRRFHARRSRNISPVRKEKIYLLQEKGFVISGIRDNSVSPHHQRWRCFYIQTNNLLPFSFSVMELWQI